MKNRRTTALVGLVVLFLAAHQGCGDDPTSPNPVPTAFRISNLSAIPTTADAATEQTIAFRWTEDINPARLVRTILRINDVDDGSEDWAYQAGSKERAVVRSASRIADSHGLGTHVYSVQLMDEDGNSTEALTVNFTIQ